MTDFRREERGRRFKRLREGFGLSYRELEKVFDLHETPVSRSSLQNFETGKGRLTPDHAQVLVLYGQLQPEGKKRPDLMRRLCLAVCDLELETQAWDDLFYQVFPPPAPPGPRPPAGPTPAAGQVIAKDKLPSWFSNHNRKLVDNELELARWTLREARMLRDAGHLAGAWHDGLWTAVYGARSALLAHGLEFVVPGELQQRLFGQLGELMAGPGSEVSRAATDQVLQTVSDLLRDIRESQARLDPGPGACQVSYLIRALLLSEGLEFLRPGQFPERLFRILGGLDAPSEDLERSLRSYLQVVAEQGYGLLGPEGLAGGREARESAQRELRRGQEVLKEARCKCERYFGGAIAHAHCAATHLLRAAWLSDGPRFVRSGSLPGEFFRVLANLEPDRQRADSDVTEDFSPRHARRWLEEVASLEQQVQEYLRPDALS